MEGVDKLFVQLHPSSRISVKKERKVLSINTVDVNIGTSPAKELFLSG